MPSIRPTLTTHPSLNPSSSPSSSPSISNMPSRTPSARPTFSSDRPSSYPTSSSQPSKAPTACSDSILKLVLPWNKKRKFCSWMGRNPKRTKGRCNRENVRVHCPLTCDVCDEYACKDSTFHFKIKGMKKTRTCNWVKRNPGKLLVRCQKTGIYQTCRETCGFCNQ